MKLTPILFSTPMVQAILAGRKTQTRRIVKPQPDDDGLWDDTNIPHSLQSTLKGWNGTVDATGESREFKAKADRGDILWVRESWTQNGLEYYRYKADWPDPAKGVFIGPAVPLKYRNKWKPSIHMPYTACRIWLKVTGVKVERVQDISEEDAISEGIEGKMAQWKDYSGSKQIHGFAEVSFRTLWKSINGPESWNANPWVWVYTFERTEKPTIIMDNKKMEEMEIIDGNKLICAFMELYQPETKDYNESFKWPDGLANNNFAEWCTAFEKLKYHCSWDWLLPVVKKIAYYTLNNVFESEAALNANLNKWIPIANSLEKIDMDALWNATASYIQWHNQQLTKNVTP